MQLPREAALSSGAEPGLLSRWQLGDSPPAPQTPLINDGGGLPQTLCPSKLPLVLVHYMRPIKGN